MVTRPAENQARGEAPTVAKLQQTEEKTKQNLCLCRHDGVFSYVCCETHNGCCCESSKSREVIDES